MFLTDKIVNKKALIDPPDEITSNWNQSPVLEFLFAWLGGDSDKALVTSFLVY